MNAYIICREKTFIMTTIPEQEVIAMAKKAAAMKTLKLKAKERRSWTQLLQTFTLRWLMDKRNLGHAKNRTMKEYLRFVRNRKSTIKVIRKAIKKQLGYVRRDLVIVERLLKVGGRLTEKQQNRLVTIKKVYAQQDEMYREKKHKVEDRIESISQSWVRPIV